MDVDGDGDGDGDVDMDVDVDGDVDGDGDGDRDRDGPCRILGLSRLPTWVSLFERRVISSWAVESAGNSYKHGQFIFHGLDLRVSVRRNPGSLSAESVLFDSSLVPLAVHDVDMW